MDQPAKDIKLQQQQKVLVKQIMMFSGFSFVGLSLVGFLMLDAVADYFGDKNTALALIAGFGFVGVCEIAMSKILFKGTDRL